MRRDNVGLALRLIDDTRDQIEMRSLIASAPPDLSLGGVASRSETARALQTRLVAIDRAALPEAVALALAVIGERIRYWAKEDGWYWSVFDPTGGELYGMFAPTPYCGGHAIGMRSGALRRMPLDNDGARYRYLAALHDFAALLDVFTERTEGQAARGIRMPRSQAEQALALIPRLAKDQDRALRIADERLAGQEAFKRDVDALIGGRIREAFEALAAVIDPAYLDAAGEAVGLGALPDGDEIYRALCRLHSSSDLSPEEIHAVGLERIAHIREGMAAARREAKFDGDDHAYRAKLDADAAWRVSEPGDLQALFQRYIDRFAPHVDALFGLMPEAGYGVRPLPDAMSEAMTFGYYEPASPGGGGGTYVYNARNLAKGGLCHLGALCYHELVPGHHLHLALQAENLALPKVRAASLPTAFTEGWAEYAATLAGEIGMYAEPAERFGRLMSEAFLASRLVVDTGMNALGWSLEQARDYMRENAFIPETEIRTETLRYSCDIPGQALAYKLGDRALLLMRERMALRMDEGFSLRAFHDAVLHIGALPMRELEAHLDRLAAC